MKQALIMNYEVNVVEVKHLEDIAEDGLYSVDGFDHPVSTEKVTEYGKEALSGQVDGFFTGADGVSRYYMETGKFMN